jgi:hypothetical protein
MALTPPSPAWVADEYLGDSTSWGPDEIQGAYDAELDAQANVCRIPVDGSYPPALAEALGRRVAHNLALRALPLGVASTVSDMAVATTSVGGLDAEVRRLEAPYRKILLG